SEGVDDGLQIGEVALAVQPLPEPGLSFLELGQAFFRNSIALGCLEDHLSIAKAVTEALRNRATEQRAAASHLTGDHDETHGIFYFLTPLFAGLTTNVA